MRAGVVSTGDEEIQRIGSKAVAVISDMLVQL
ncbi:hypothetical protein ES702_01122 [subsurface metagenome]